MDYEYEGATVAADDQGFLLDTGKWNPTLAILIAQRENIAMQDDHWAVVYFLRNYYEEYRIAPAMRVLTRAISKTLGPDKGNSRYLYRLFPNGPAIQACKIAGLPKPTGCV
jgi:TusE/DsrC/DsvC family sulfur relay protein